MQVSKLNPYIGFAGEAKPAMEFYKSIFGGNLTISSFKESGAPSMTGNLDDIMHAQLVAENGMTLMASDTGAKPSDRISISLSGDNETELTEYWNKLSEGAKVEQPLTKAPWGDMFGMLTDKFGIKWMVNIAGKKS